MYFIETNSLRTKIFLDSLGIGRGSEHECMTVVGNLGFEEFFFPISLNLLWCVVHALLTPDAGWFFQSISLAPKHQYGFP